MPNSIFKSTYLPVIFGVFLSLFFWISNYNFPISSLLTLPQFKHRRALIYLSNGYLLSSGQILGKSEIYPVNSTFPPLEQLGPEVLIVGILYQASEKILLDQSAWKLKCSLFIIILFFFTMYSVHENSGSWNILVFCTV